MTHTPVTYVGVRRENKEYEGVIRNFETKNNKCDEDNETNTGYWNKEEPFVFCKGPDQIICEGPDQIICEGTVECTQY